MRKGGRALDQFGSVRTNLDPAWRTFWLRYIDITTARAAAGSLDLGDGDGYSDGDGWIWAMAMAIAATLAICPVPLARPASEVGGF